MSLRLRACWLLGSVEFRFVMTWPVNMHVVLHLKHACMLGGPGIFAIFPGSLHVSPGMLVPVAVFLAGVWFASGLCLPGLF